MRHLIKQIKFISIKVEHCKNTILQNINYSRYENKRDMAENYARLENGFVMIPVTITLKSNNDQNVEDIIRVTSS